ncbi:hypothetical protein [Sphingobacterium sp. UME9]|uniref:hypothetical protein n=1 Tax=Sphingobacterium sp. UME9 TaxID=1862316 RepID=UPI0016013DAC|nr:hypothetical protein [Sphingobacterium sp. UME9]
MESRIPGDRYVRFGGEFLETYHSQYGKAPGSYPTPILPRKPKRWKSCSLPMSWTATWSRLSSALPSKDEKKQTIINQLKFQKQ